VLDNFSTGNRDNLGGLEGDVELVEGDLRSYERVHAAVRGVEVVFHQGALPSVPRSVQDPLTTTAVNVEGTLNVLLAARDEAVRRVVNASSSSVYGNVGGLPRAETQLPDPISPYAVAKLAAERYCVSFSRVYDSFETVVVRYFNVFGPRQSPFSQYAAVIPLFVTAIHEGRPITVFGDGEQRRDFIHVDDVVDVNLWFLEHREVSGIFNCGTGRAQTFNQLAAAAINALRGTDHSARELAQHGAIEYIPFPPGLRERYQSFTEADLTRLRAAGYRGEFRTVEHGVASYVNELRKG
jgi:UDP-glucose 4-epimerase